MLGTLPLAIGMRVALTEHIDRSDGKQLLRGTVGTVRSWVWEADSPRPSIVYVKFEDVDWQLEGTEEPGIYPIIPKKNQWHLDKGRKTKVLKVTRTQLPLTPAYAMTAHSSQGKTLRAVLLDLNVDKRVDPTIGTVAATRVRSREDVLIMRPFPLFLYTRGLASDGPDLLLKKLRGEDIDWAAVREAKRPCAVCEGCRADAAHGLLRIRRHGSLSGPTRRPSARRAKRALPRSVAESWMPTACRNTAASAAARTKLPRPSRGRSWCKRMPRPCAGA